MLTSNFDIRKSFAAECGHFLNALKNLIKACKKIYRKMFHKNIVKIFCEIFILGGVFEILQNRKLDMKISMKMLFLKRLQGKKFYDAKA